MMERTLAHEEGDSQVLEGEIIPPMRAGFDYSVLPTNIGAEAKIAADEIRALIRRGIVDVGAALSRIKDRLPHGQFGKWLSAEFGLTERTAQNYMAVAALVSKYEAVSDLQQKTLCLLASPSTPEPIRQAVIARFGAGERIPDRTIKEMIGQAKVRQQEEPRRADEAARDAQLSPRTRRSRAQRKAEEERQQQEWKREQAEKEAATNQAADLLMLHLPLDAAARLRDLLRNCERYALVDTLLCRIEHADLQPIEEAAGDPPAPNCKPPASEAPPNDAPLEKIPVPAKGIIADDPLSTLQRQYFQLSDQLGGYDWAMRRVSLGETPGKDEKGEVAAFACYFITVPAAIQNQFRASIGARPGNLVASHATRL